MGVEKEADLIQLFPIFLSLFPNLKLNIVMIGPAISKNLKEEHQKYTFKNATGHVKISLISSLYNEKINNLPHDGIINLNAGIINNTRVDG